MTPAEKLAAKKKAAPQLPKLSMSLRSAPWAGNPLLKLREGLKLSTRAVADSVGLSPAAYWLIEQGADLKLTSALRIAAFYGLDVAEIWSQ